MKWLGRADPLVLFLVVGLTLYLILDALGLARGDDRLIAVDDAALSAFFASEGGQMPGRTLDALKLEERRKLVEDYVREEALYREARALGLDRDDSAIRRRLVQSLRFSLQGEGEGEGEGGAAEPSEADLRTFFAANRDRYTESAKLSFSHIYFDKALRGSGAARDAARQALALAGKGDWLAMGDRYPYQRSQVELREDALASELGEEAARRIFAMAAQGERWQGPVESELGFHLIRIDRSTAGSEPVFAQIRGELVAGLERERREKQLQRAVDGIVEGYRVEMSPELEKQLR
ncbi:MAG: peptidylprolyl isomerase [Novosphingobium sp.]|nr:peptidylprolyl isomerase [Novosphingobium sp.]